MSIVAQSDNDKYSLISVTATSLLLVKFLLGANTISNVRVPFRHNFGIRIIEIFY